jgi:hypothetical protein
MMMDIYTHRQHGFYSNHLCLVLMIPLCNRYIVYAKYDCDIQRPM